MRKTGLIILAVSGALTILSAIIWLVGLILGIGGALIHLFLISTLLWIMGVVVGIVLFLIGKPETKS